MHDPLVQVARGQLDRMLARLRAGITRTPRIDAALAQLETATADLVAWAETSPVRVPGDSLETPIAPWVRAIDELQAAMHPEEGEEGDEVEYFMPPDTPLKDWIAGVEALLAKLDTGPSPAH
jgi:hypothetical protein